jgi:predicted transcriptional regulator
MVVTKKVKTSFTLSLEVVRLIKELAEKYTISKTSVVEIAVRKYAESEDIYFTSE